MKRKNKNIYIFLIILTVIGLSIGYAVLNSTLIINGVSNIQKNVWSIHFENVEITSGSVEAVKVPTIVDNTSIDFETKLNLPGDYYEFTVDVKNSGTIDAMIESIIKEPELTIEQQKYLNYIIEYHNGEQLEKNQLVKANEFVRLKVRVEIKKDLSASDLPDVGEVLNLGFTVNYVQADNNGISVKDNGTWLISANGLLEDIGTVVTIGTEKFYTIGTEGENVKLLSMYNLHVGNIISGIVEEDDNKIPIVEPITGPKGFQSSRAIGAVVDFNNDYIYKFPWVGTVSFSSEEQHGEKYNSYEGSIVEGYVNNYENLLEEKYDVDVLSSRLLILYELVSLISGDSYCIEGISSVSCLESTYPWLFSTSYWTGIYFSDDNLGSLIKGGYFGNVPYNADYAFGVRPVIVISKDSFK